MYMPAQIDKFCPIRNGRCTGDCSFYVRENEGKIGDKDYCQISEYLRAMTSSAYTSTSSKKTLLEGSDKKV